MKVSIFTPTNDSSFLPEVYQSIKDQPFFEWNILYNNGGKPLDFGDSRVRHHIAPIAPVFVGALKRAACELCTGDILLECDHDDLLLGGALEAVIEAFADPAVGFVYSNAVRCTGDFKPVPRFTDGNGWQYRPYEFRGQTLEEVVAFAPEPVNVSRIWYAPDHLRAFRRSVYEEVGGYSADMRVLDDQDLMARLFQRCEFKHVDRPLYLYRVHGANAWLKHNQEIQNNVMRLHDQYIEPMAAAWAKRRKLLSLDLGGRFNPASGFQSVDRRDADFICDLEKRWPFEDGSVGVVRAYDIFEHLHDSIHTMTELWRVLAPGGLALIQVPSTDGRGAFQDPTHCSYFNQNSFLYYTDRRWARYIDTPVRFQAIQLQTTTLDVNQVCWVQAHLRKLDKGERVAGPVRV